MNRTPLGIMGISIIALWCHCLRGRTTLLAGEFRPSTSQDMNTVSTSGARQYERSYFVGIAWLTEFLSRIRENRSTVNQ